MIPYIFWDKNENRENRRYKAIAELYDDKETWLLYWHVHQKNWVTLKRVDGSEIAFAKDWPDYEEVDRQMFPVFYQALEDIGISTEPKT